MRTITVKTRQNVEFTYRLASLGLRLSAFLIDAFIVYFSLFVIFMAAVGTAFTLPIIVGGILMAGVYHLIMEVLNNGQSLGKMAMNIRVIKANGEKPGVGDYLMRWMFRILDFTLTSGAVAILSFSVTEKRQRLGDILANTVVIDQQKVKNFSLADAGKKAVQKDEEDSEAPETTEIVYPEVSLLSEADLRKIDALYRKLLESDYPPSVRRKMYERMKRILEKKMGISTVDKPAQEFLKQVYQDFKTLQHQQQEEDLF